MDEVSLELSNVLPKHGWAICHASHDAKATGVCYCCDKFGACDSIHSREHYRMIDAEQVGDRGLDSLCHVNMVSTLSYFFSQCGHTWRRHGAKSVLPECYQIQIESKECARQ